jgi:hypothetical protein
MVIDVERFSENISNAKITLNPGNLQKNGPRVQKKCQREEKLLATLPGEGIIPAPATSAFTEG